MRNVEGIKGKLIEISCCVLTLSPSDSRPPHTHKRNLRPRKHCAPLLCYTEGDTLSKLLLLCISVALLSSWDGKDQVCTCFHSYTVKSLGSFLFYSLHWAGDCFVAPLNTSISNTHSFLAQFSFGLRTSIARPQCFSLVTKLHFSRANIFIHRKRHCIIFQYAILSICSCKTGNPQH